MKKQMLWMVLILILMVVTGGGYYFYSQNFSPSATAVQLHDNSTVPSSEKVQSDSVSKTKTYSDSTYGFAVDYSTKLAFEAPVTTPQGGDEVSFTHNTSVAYVPAVSSNGVERGSLNFNISTDSGDVARCLVDPHYQDVMAYTAATTTINGVSFLSYTITPDLYRGGDISTTYYKTLHNGTCYGIVEILQNNLTPRQAATAEKIEVSAQLNLILQSFRFTK